MCVCVGVHAHTSHHHTPQVRLVVILSLSSTSSQTLVNITIWRRWTLKPEMSIRLASPAETGIPMGCTGQPSLLGEFQTTESLSQKDVDSTWGTTPAVLWPPCACARSIYMCVLINYNQMNKVQVLWSILLILIRSVICVPQKHSISSVHYI